MFFPNVWQKALFVIWIWILSRLLVHCPLWVPLVLTGNNTGLRDYQKGTISSWSTHWPKAGSFHFHSFSDLQGGEVVTKEDQDPHFQLHSRRVAGVCGAAIVALSSFPLGCCWRPNQWDGCRWRQVWGAQETSARALWSCLLSKSPHDWPRDIGHIWRDKGSALEILF